MVVATKIKAVITPEEKESILKSPTTNMAAMQMYICGSELSGLSLADRKQMVELYKQAEIFYRKAIGLDSAYADAWVQ
jgi:hypothetical protein